MGTSQFQRNTRQRAVIVEELCKTTAHPTAVELYEVVRRRLPKISLGTVYRNLDLLARLGIIDKLDLSGAEARFDGDVRPHTTTSAAPVAGGSTICPDHPLMYCHGTTMIAVVMKSSGIVYSSSVSVAAARRSKEKKRRKNTICTNRRL